MLSLPAEIVWIWEMCGESDFSIHVLYCHDVLGAFVLDFTRPTKAGINTIKIEIHKCKKKIPIQLS